MYAKRIRPAVMSRFASCAAELGLQREIVTVDGAAELPMLLTSNITAMTRVVI
jgi:hypothetical protein